MKSISTKLIALLTIAAILPLILFGILTIINARETAITSIQKGNLQSARYASGQIMQYINNSLNILESLAQNINSPDINLYQRERILRNYAINFREFNYIETVKTNGFVLTSTKLEKDGHKREALLQPDQFNLKGNHLSDIFITDDRTPAMIISTPLKHLGNTNGILIAELDLMNMWHLVDEMTIGKKGYVNIVTDKGRLIASGHPSLKEDVFRKGVYRNIDTLKNIESSDSLLSTLQNGNEEITLAIVKLPQPLNWFIIIEQPTEEAYLLATSMTTNLIILITAFIFVVTVTGYFSGRRYFVKPIQTLIGMAKGIADGNLSQHVNLSSNDELGELAKSFNQMSNNLIELKENVQKKERMAVFGRIASGLAHDLKHPIQSIKNVCRLLTQSNGSSDYTDIVNSTFTREFQKIDNFLENLHNLTKDIPYNPVNLDPNKVLLETVFNFQQQLRDNSIELNLKLSESPTLIHADYFSLIRVFSNLILNAIQACSKGDSITIESENINPKLFIIRIEDTGQGIAKEEIKNIFEDFTTTKHSGLGLGLALCKRILDQHNATIHVESTINEGTILKLTFNRL